MSLRLKDFAGAWALSREIEDRRAGAMSQLRGQARFETAQEGLTLIEQGKLYMPGVAQPFEAERRYLWTEQGADIVVFFEDGRYFHRFDPNGDAPKDRHDCAPDLYNVCYDFSRWPSWSATWRVTGPRKDYLSVTQYTPV